MTNNPYRIEGPVLVSFSGGQSSGFILKQILDASGGRLPEDVYAVFFNTGKEMPETLDFVQECSMRWRCSITWLEYAKDEPHQTAIVNHNSASRNGEPFVDVIKNRRFLPNPVTRFCTSVLKVKRGIAFMRDMKGHEHRDSALGLRADERRRVAKARQRNESGKERFDTVMPLAEAGIARRDVVAFWNAQPFDLRLPNVNGVTPLGNCDLCFLKGAATLLGIVRDRPELSRWWIEQEASVTGATAKPDGARFRADRPTYAEMLRLVQTQGDLFIDLPNDEAIPCMCTD